MNHQHDSMVKMFLNMLQTDETKEEIFYKVLALLPAWKQEEYLSALKKPQTKKG